MRSDKSAIARSPDVPGKCPSRQMLICSCLGLSAAPSVSSMLHVSGLDCRLNAPLLCLDGDRHSRKLAENGVEAGFCEISQVAELMLSEFDTYLL
jgi:hypothetical protein